MSCALLLITCLFASTAQAQPQVSFYNDAPIVLTTALTSTGVAIDANGNIYIADAPDVSMIPATCAAGGDCTVTALSPSSFSYPTGIAVDASGKIYVVDQNLRAVMTIPATCATGGDCTVTTLVSSGFSSPYGVAVGANGNIYVTDQGNNSVKMVPATCATGGDCTVTTLASGIGNPHGLTVDVSGNIYVVDYNANTLDMIPASCATGGDCTVKVLASGFLNAYDVALDASGNIYIADYGNNALEVIPATCATGGACTMMTLASGSFTSPTGVAVDASGNVYVGDMGTLKEITMAAPRLNFGSTAVGATSSPQTVPITNVSDQPLTIPALPAGFTFDASNTCTAGSTLAAGASCNLVIDFTPTAAGNVTGSYTLTNTQVVQLLGTGAASAPPMPVCTVTTPASGSPVAPDTNVAITCTNVPSGDTLTIPGTTCVPTPSTGVNVVCTGNDNAIGNDPPATVTDPSGNSSTSTVPLQILPSPSSPLPPQVPNCVANPNPQAAGSTVTITCTGGTPGAAIAIPGTTCTPATLDANGATACSGTAGTTAGTVNSNPPVTVTITTPTGNLSNSATVPFQVVGSPSTALPNCVASPNPANTATPVTITCTNVTPGDTITIPGTDCNPSTAAPASGTVVCTGTGGDIGSNPPLTVTDPTTGDNGGTIPLTVDPTPPPAPICTVTTPATGSPVPPDTNVAITCTNVPSGDTLTIPGTTCTPSPSTGTNVVCTGNDNAIGNNPPATVTDPAGNSSTSDVPLQITQSAGDPTPPQVPVCSAPSVATGQTVTLTCTAGTPGATISIPGVTCTPTALNAAGGTTCTGTAGTCPPSALVGGVCSVVSNNPPVTVTDPTTNLSNSGLASFQIADSSPNPPLPVCTASPNPAGGGTLVTISCSGGTPGNTVAIPGCTPDPITLTAGTVTCTGTGGVLGNNPPDTVTDPTTGNTSHGTVPLNVDSAPPNAPDCQATPNPADATTAVTITCTVDPNTSTVIAGCTPDPMPSGTGTTVTCTGTGASLGNNPPATSTDANGNTNSSTVPLQVQGANTPPAPTCTATPNPGTSNQPVQITCTGLVPGDTLTIANTTDCVGQAIPVTGTLTCHGTAGTGANQINNDPIATQTDPNTNQANSTLVPFKLDGTANPALPNCVASPNPASSNQTVTVTCTGVTPGDTLTIPNTDCTPSAAATAANTTIACVGIGGPMGNNPPLTVTDPDGNTTKGNIPLTLIDRLLTTVPALGIWLCSVLGGLILLWGGWSLRRRGRTSLS